MKVILISGHAQNGKDTCAGYMLKKLQSDGYKCQICHYADLLKFICQKYFGWDGEKDEKGRQILQYVGTDIVRRKYPNYWVDFIIMLLTMFREEWDYVLIPDTRFPNEVDEIFSYFDGWHIRVVRENFESPLTEEQKKHPSETALDSVVPDFTILNNGTLEDLKAAALATLERIINEK